MQELYYSESIFCLLWYDVHFYVIIKSTVQYTDDFFSVLYFIISSLHNIVIVLQDEIHVISSTVTRFYEMDFKTNNNSIAIIQLRITKKSLTSRRDCSAEFLCFSYICWFVYLAYLPSSDELYLKNTNRHFECYYELSTFHHWLLYNIIIYLLFILTILCIYTI